MGFLTGKTAIITGGGRAVLSDGSCGSIGYGIATAYAKEGANLVITGRNVKKLEDAKEELEKQGRSDKSTPGISAETKYFPFFSTTVNNGRTLGSICKHCSFIFF